MHLAYQHFEGDPYPKDPSWACMFDFLAGKCDITTQEKYDAVYGTDYATLEQPQRELLCNPGYQYYKYTWGQAYCFQCDSGTYSAVAGAREETNPCYTCRANTYSLPGATRCTSCPKGLESAPGSSACRFRCDAGTHRVADVPDNGKPCLVRANCVRSLCAPCPVNHYALFDAAECTRCPDVPNMQSTTPAGSSSCTYSWNAAALQHRGSGKSPLGIQLSAGAPRAPSSVAVAVAVLVAAVAAA